MLNCCFIYPNLTLVSVTTPTTNYDNVSTIAFLKLLCVEERTLITLLSGMGVGIEKQLYTMGNKRPRSAE